MGLGGAKQLPGLTALCFSNVRHHIPTLRIRGVAGFHIHAELGIQLTELRGRSPSKWQNGQCYWNWSNTRPPCIIFWKKFSWLTCWRYRETNTEVCPQICSATIAAKMPKPRLHWVEIFIVLINSSVGPITSSCRLLIFMKWLPDTKVFDQFNWYCPFCHLIGERPRSGMVVQYGRNRDLGIHDYYWCFVNNMPAICWKCQTRIIDYYIYLK